MVYILIVICILLIMIYYKLNNLTIQTSINRYQEIIDSDDEENENDFNEIKDNEFMQQSSDKKLIKFPSQMSKYKEFLNPSLTVDIEDVFQKLELLLDIEENNIESKKLSFLSEISLLILRNGYKFTDFKIDLGVYGKRFPLTHKIIRFDIKNISLIKKDPDFISDEYQADFIFSSNNGEEIIIKHKYYEDSMLSDKMLEKYFEKFEYVKYFDEKAKYDNRYKVDDRKLCFSLEDLGSYIDFIGQNYYNKKFMTFWKEDELFKDIEIIDFTWHPEKSTTFFYETMDPKLREELKEGKREILSSLYEYDEFIFNQMYEKKDTLSMYEYCYYMYFDKAYDTEKLTSDKGLNIIKIIEKLIEMEYPIAYIFKAILHIDGIIVLKNYEESKKLLKKAYDLGVKRPALNVWNENNFS